MEAAEFYGILLKQVARDFQQRLKVLQLSQGEMPREIPFTIYVEDKNVYFTYLSDGQVIQVPPSQ